MRASWPYNNNLWHDNIACVCVRCCCYNRVFRAAQEQEIYQKCIRGPPNRTIWPSAAECGKLSQPHRSSSASGLTSLSTSSSEVDSVTRCNSVSSRYVYVYALFYFFFFAFTVVFTFLFAPIPTTIMYGPTGRAVYPKPTFLPVVAVNILSRHSCQSAYKW